VDAGALGDQGEAQLVPVVVAEQVQDGPVDRRADAGGATTGAGDGGLAYGHRPILTRSPLP
jgi:hypothetical protein